MNAPTKSKAPIGYLSGWCREGAPEESHQRCRGRYAGTACRCPHHFEPEPPAGCDLCGQPWPVGVPRTAALGPRSSEQCARSPEATA